MPYIAVEMFVCVEYVHSWTATTRMFQLAGIGDCCCFVEWASVTLYCMRDRPTDRVHMWVLHPGTCQDVGTVGCQLNDIPAARHTVWSIAYRCRAQNNWQTLMTINCNNYTKLTTITLSSHQLRAAVSYDIMSTGSRAFLVLLRC